MREGAMSAANIALVQGLYAAFGRGDIDTIVAAAAPDIRWQVVGRKEDYPILGIHNGPKGVLAFFKAVADAQETVAFTPRDFHAADGMVFVLGHYVWKLRKNGNRVDTDWMHIFTIENGKVTDFREFTDTAQFAQAYRG
jgi:ketosteroid isomerase-like protein